MHKVLNQSPGDFFDRGPLHIFSLDESGVILHANNTALQNTVLDMFRRSAKNSPIFCRRSAESFDNAINNIHDGELSAVSHAAVYPKRCDACGIFFQPD
ncbi:MAG: hypothetical protein R3C26_05800 [Calditrichia bacterium]